ncbi:hypothetical protein HBI23_046870 [Parastagonospora nodorum]|nr:hypothetical protein HBI12_031830 [Parastagonospora nodorum]KAH5453806.1 hypothetical protein HBI47_014590 [Parastagonospora nodorum]KAH5685791.1 hypothetical protein HBI23_046870 [Parastagonospora nodorum]
MPTHMHFPKTTNTDFDRPLNTSFEDSIHMPQNNNNRNRRRAGNPQPPATAPPARNIGTATVQRTPQSQTRSGGAYSAPACDEASSTFRSTKPSFVMADAEARVVLPISQNDTRKSSNPWTEGFEQEVRSRIRRGDSRPIAEGHQGSVRKPEPSTEKVPYSKIHEQKITPQAPAETPETGFLFTSHLGNSPSSPMRLVDKSKSDAYPTSPILNHVRKLREDDQDRVFAQLGEDLGCMVFRSDEPAKEERENVKKTSSPRFIPRMDLSSGSDWSKPLHAIAKSPKPVVPEMEAVQSKRPGVSTPAKAPPIVNRGPHQKSKINQLAEATAKIDVFQNIIVKPPVTLSSAQDVVVPTRRALNIAKNPKKSTEEATKSTDLIASFDSDDFEMVDMPEIGESEQNGVPKKWFGGLRR